MRGFDSMAFKVGKAGSLNLLYKDIYTYSCDAPSLGGTDNEFYKKMKYFKTKINHELQ